MLKKDLLEKIKNAKEDEDINSLLSGTDIEESFKSSGLTLEAFKGKMNEKEYKAFLESENDKYHNKALKTMKEKGTWEGEFSDVLTQKYPDLVTDPTKKQLVEIQKELAAAKAEAAREKMLTQAIAYASEKKLPANLVDKFLGEDLDTTKANLDVLADSWSKGLEKVVDEKLKNSSYVPGNGTDGSSISIGAAIAAQSNNKNTVASDPWASK